MSKQRMVTKLPHSSKTKGALAGTESGAEHGMLHQTLQGPAQHPGPWRPCKAPSRVQGV